jgi:MerR family transcriptional regulator, light-induced transcriptional regulator
MTDYRHTAKALEFLSDHSEEIIAQVVEHQCSAVHDAWSSPAFRQRCLEDNRFHLHYLTASVSAANAQIFADYCGWAKVVLSRRGIPDAHLRHNLEQLRNVLLRAAPEIVADVIVGHLDVAIERFSAYPNEPQPIPAAKAGSKLLNDYIDRILAFDSEGAIQLIQSRASDASSVIELCLNVLQPAQREIGRLWQINSISVAVEHYATSVAEQILHILSHTVPPHKSRARRVVYLCPEGEHHCIGMHMVSSLSRLDGWEPHVIGPNTPLNAAVDLITRLQPALVGISITTFMALSSTQKLIARLKQALPRMPILVGGYAAGHGEEIWKSLGADAYAPDALSALSIISKLVAQEDGALRTGSVA